MVEGVRDYAIFMLDPEGRVMSWNLGAERIKGYAAADIIGKHFSVFYMEDARRNKWPEHELTVAADRGRFEDEGWRVRKDGSRFWANVIITAIRDRTGTLQGFAKVTRDLTERRKAEQLLRDSHQRLDQRVRERTAELTRLAQALQDEISERERLEAELRRRVEALHQSDYQKNTFLAMLSHELRNPLAAMRNALHLLQRTDAERDPHGAATILSRQLDHIVRLVNDLMDVTRIVQDRIELRRETIDLVEAVHMALETARPAMEAQRHRLEVSLPDDPVLVQGDMVRLTQAFSNLLLNAAKYTDPGGRIHLELARLDGQAILRVRDTGIGIAPELQRRVFDLFVQGRPSIDRSKGGLGIGLTLVRRIVEMHDGSVHVYSQGVGKGSEFSVRLPVQRTKGTETGSGASSREAGTPSSRRILVVDDNQDAADTLAAIMRAVGHQVQVAYDGPGALEAARHFIPDLVLLDIGLPGMNGYDVARHLRSELSGRSLALIALTGYGQEEDKKRAREAGFDAHLIKPVDFQLLEAILDR
jgi:PAS domain S-box-containing protein